MSEKAFSPEEVDEILRRALARQQASSDGVKRDELVEAAGEVGIDASDVDAAIRELDAERGAAPASKSRDEAAIAIAKESRQRRLHAFYRHLGIYVVVNAALFAMSRLTGGSDWFIWPLLGWGIGIGSHAVNVLFPKEPRLSRRERRRLRRDRGFEAAVERGVEKILAKHAGSHVDAPALRARVGERAQEAEAAGEEQPREPKQKKVGEG